jgi:hypothetical protein
MEFAGQTPSERQLRHWATRVVTDASFRHGLLTSEEKVAGRWEE